MKESELQFKLIWVFKNLKHVKKLGTFHGKECRVIIHCIIFLLILNLLKMLVNNRVQYNTNKRKSSISLFVLCSDRGAASNIPQFNDLLTMGYGCLIQGKKIRGK